MADLNLRGFSNVNREPVEVRRKRVPQGNDGQGQSQSARPAAHRGLEIDAPPGDLPSVWRYESCLECRMRMPSDDAAEAHYGLTGHPMGWPIEADAMSWPIMGEALEGPADA